MKADLKVEMEILEGVNITLDNGIFTIKGEKGEVTKKLWHPLLSSKVEANKIILSATKATQREKKLMFTYRAHLNNMMNGVKDGVIYKLKICSSHFPMTVEMKDRDVSIKNFLGEKIPRKTKIPKDVEVEIKKDIITIKSIDKELAGQASANFEAATRVRGRDRRVFQDGIFITNKAGREM